MDIKRMVARNVLANIGGHAITVLVGFFVMPFLVHELGNVTYGIWVVIGSLTGWFGMLDLGVRGSLGRYVAFYHAQDDRAGVDGAVSTAIAILCGCAVITLAGVVGISAFVFHIMRDVPFELRSATRLALVLVGANLAIGFPLRGFDGVLWGRQRFDLINGVDVPTSLVRAGLIFVFIGMGHGLVALGVITIVCTVGAGAAKAVLVFRQDPALSVRPGQMSAAMARKLFTFGFWQFVVSIGITVRKTIPRLVIGWWMGPGMVTPFSIAERLPMQARQLHVSATGVITPLAAALHARDDDARQKQLMIWGARFCGAMALCFAVPFILLGRPFITLWMGKEFAGVAVLLAILSVGEFLPLTQQVTGSIIVGKAKHRSLAILELLSAVLIAGGTVLAIVRHELLGVCINVAAVTTVTHGAARIILGCRMLGVSSKQYILGGILPPLLAVMPAAGLLALLVAWRGADSWTMLLAYGAVYVICYAVTCLLLIGRDMRRNLIRGTATMLSGN